MRPKFLLFDADDTLFDFKRAEREAMHDVLTKNLLPTTPEVLDKYATINLQLWKALEKGEVTRQELFSLRFTRLLDYIRQEAVWHKEWELDDFDWDAANGEVYNERFLDALARQPFLVADAESVIPELAESYTIALITNGVERVQRLRLQMSPLAEHVEAVFVSEALGVEKPSPLFFEQACDALGIKDRQEALVIGDSLSADIRGGNLSGIRTCWFNPYGQALPEGEDVPVPDYEIASLRELPKLLGII